MTVLPELVDAPSPNRSSRRGARVRLVVWHETVGGYTGAVSWLRNPAAQASAHVVEREDGLEASQLVPWAEKAWTCVAYNAVSDNLEMAGRGPTWNLAELRAAARIVAFRLHKRGLPPRWARAGIGVGYTRHKDLGRAGGGHVDPVMAPATWRLCRFLVKAELARGRFRPEWGR
jgi:hypothetical protein